VSTVAEEQVLVVPTAEFHSIGHFQGFSKDVDKYFDRLVGSANVSYRPRGEMEQDPSFKQLIPYVVFRYQNSDGEVMVFNYQRGGGVGERRLAAKRSVGVGGHISTLDSTAGHHEKVYREGLRRELEEEVTIATDYQESVVGLINDDETEVGRVHFGVVHLFDVAAPKVLPAEPDMVDARFSLASELLKDLDRYESWSQIAVRALFA
jgi:predicted NUDIX family phosphoesterase